MRHLEEWSFDENDQSYKDIYNGPITTSTIGLSRKKVSRSYPNNYRPIAITFILAKIMTKILFSFFLLMIFLSYTKSSIHSFADDNTLLLSYYFAKRPSTSTVLI